MINENNEPTTPFKLSTGTKPSVSHFCVLFYPCVVRKDTVYVDKMALNMHHQAQTHSRGILVGISQHQKRYHVYLPSTWKIISSYYIVFDESFSIALAYTSLPYSETIAMRLYVSYTPCAISSKGKTGDKLTFAQFEERDLLSETREYAEIDDKSSDKSDDDSIMPPLISLEETSALNSEDESDDETMTTNVLEDIRDRSQYYMDVDRKDACYKIRNYIKQRKFKWKGAFKRYGKHG